MVELKKIEPDSSSSRVITITIENHKNVFNCWFVITKLSQCQRYCLIDNLQHATTSELLVFDKRNIWLDSSRVTVHQKANGARWSEYRRLSISIAMLSTVCENIIPNLSRRIPQMCWAGIKQPLEPSFPFASIFWIPMKEGIYPSNVTPVLLTFKKNLGRT